MKLKERFPNIEFMTPVEAATKLGWEFNEYKGSIYCIKCCGEDVQRRSVYANNNYTERAYCLMCGKSMQYISTLIGCLIDDIEDEKDEDGELRLWYIPKEQNND